MKQLIHISIFFSLVFGQENHEFVKDYYHYSLHDIETFESAISFGLGELTLGANEKLSQLNGSIFYSKKLGEPQISMDRRSGYGEFEFELEMDYGNLDLDFSLTDWDFDVNDMHNEMEFLLPINIPTDLELEFGVGEAIIDLTNIQLSKFDLGCGMSDVTVIVEKSNKLMCDKVSIEIGMAEFKGIGLGHLNSNDYSVDVGLGDATIDLTGSFYQDAELDINVGLGSLNLVLPKNANITLKADHSFLASVDVNDLEKEHENAYKSKEWNRNFPTLEIDISVGLGDVDVRVER